MKGPAGIVSASLSFWEGPAPADLEARLPRPNSLRRAGDAARAAVAAAADAFRDAGVRVSERTGAYVGQQQIPLAYCAEFLEQSYREGPRFASPLLFSESVANNAATHLSLTFGMTGPLQTFIGSRAAGLQALAAAAEDLAEGVVDAALVVILSFSHELTGAAYRAAFRPFARRGGGPPLRFRDGAAALVLARDGRRPLLRAASVSAGRDPAAQRAAVRTLWEEAGRPAPVVASFFSLARARSEAILRDALGDAVRMPPEEPEAFALDPIARALDPQGPGAAVCLGEEGGAGILVLGR